jgi:hypothetical protein
MISNKRRELYCLINTFEQDKMEKPQDFKIEYVYG